jgi:hypothetical protein
MRTRPTKRYFQAFGALYGNTDISGIKPQRPRKKRDDPEAQEQIKFNVWFVKEMEPKGYRWFHSPNGGARNAQEGAKFKRMGVKPGVPDIVLPMPRKSYHGLVIELKRVDGSIGDLSDSQNDWLNWFKTQQWSVHVAFGFEEAKKIVTDYFY